MGKQVSAHSVLITGANRGLGLEMVKQLLRSNGIQNLICTCREPHNAPELQQIANDNAIVKVLQLDVTNLEHLQPLVDTVTELVGENGLGLLINNAGILRGAPQSMNATTPDDLMDHYRVHVAAPYALVKAFRPLLKMAASRSAEQVLSPHKAAVINISSDSGSISSITPARGDWFPLYSYSIAKAGMNMLTRLLGFDLASDGIMTVAIHPGWVQTDMGTSAATLTTETSIQRVFKVITDLTPDHNGLLLAHDGHVMAW